MDEMIFQQDSDEELYDLFRREGNEEALLVLIKRHRESLVLFINGYVHNMGEAEELAMDTFADVAAGPTVFSQRSSFKTWLFSVGKNIALKYIRKSRFSAMSPATQTVPLDDNERSAAAVQDDAAEMHILKSERNRRLYEALSMVSDEYRTVLTLLYFEDMSYDEAAKVMHRNKKQVYNLAERGRRALRRQLEQMQFEIDDV